jgi:hypothetical protein
MSEQTSAPRESKEERREGKGRGRGRAGRDEPDSEAQGMDFEDLEPGAPVPALNPVGADVSPVEIFYYGDDDEQEIDPVERSIVTDVDYEADEVDNFEGELLRSLQTAGGPGGVLVVLNGNAYLMTAQQAGVLIRHLQRTASASY